MSTAEPPSSAATTTATSSLLDKPLHQLTEDDISQVTREQCRRFLKNKGMRQPAWNKSKAVQQVILLKALLEPAPPESEDGGGGGGGGGGRRPCSIKQTPATRVQKGTNVDTEISFSVEELVPTTEKTDFVGDNDSAVPIGVGGGVAEEAKKQMTIFYSGKVNVYDDMPADKAQALLQLAASQLQFPQETPPFDGNVFQAPGINVGPDFSAVISPNLHTVRSADNHRLHRVESNMLREENSGSASRKASLQRFREKRHRYKSQRKAGGAPPCGTTTINVYLNHQIGTHHNLHEQSSRSATCSPPPVRPPNTPNRFS